ncbi:MAG TPA: CDP-diacylglycerol--glycerol-3-phosphate 3-phosphatidyltransferase [Saprospiraceae bacterium]|nr:CDP-diacylglycerol--glycerol-3-phosphate 3-phosphatidyltransferase [Saprospiraceae bacterium]MCB9327169.1 CDP-diacylglycerol--glycerol-3-phosphate 3-phosphatidyltransferase [Lewinellaceae bacterium]HRX29751.1 CDP-diacylglycerol--glycerol-3-phosphate 3-phosphatidyltransferase [Saprospiraceae bacterium]
MAFKKYNIPNIISVARVPMAIACSYLAFQNTFESLVWSFLLFLLASITDYIDGYLARKWNIVSNFGKIMDPIADKILILGVLLAFYVNGLIPIYIFIILSLREIGLTVIRLILVSKKVILQSEYSGKVKTFSQIIYIIVIYVISITSHYYNYDINEDIVKWINYVLLAWIVFITLYSGYEFIKNNKKAIVLLFD